MQSAPPGATKERVARKWNVGKGVVEAMPADSAVRLVSFFARIG